MSKKSTDDADDRFRISEELGREARRLIPSSSQTFSKAPTQYPQGVSPRFIKSGRGFHVWDVDDNEYIDLPLALGPIVLGHAYPEVQSEVRRQLADGPIFSLPHRLEIDVAELLVDLIPCAEMVRFGKNGSDATAGAVRLARAATGRDRVAVCGYHGWQDWYIGSTDRKLGVPQAVSDLTSAFSYNDISSLRHIFDRFPGEVAAVIMEPVGIEEPMPGFLNEVKRLTASEEAILIFDEVLTGFRLDLRGAQHYYGVVPDLACFGKAMANGFPVSAVVGRQDLMELFDEVFFSFTFGGDTIGLAAAKATIQVMIEQDVVKALWDSGAPIHDGFNDLAKAYGLSDVARCSGLPPRTVCYFGEDGRDLVAKSLFQQECIARGVLFSGSNFTCLQTTSDDIGLVLSAFEGAMKVLQHGLESARPQDLLAGQPVEPVFRNA